MGNKVPERMNGGYEDSQKEAKKSSKETKKKEGEK